jgi:hypothetical protein
VIRAHTVNEALLGVERPCPVRGHLKVTNGMLRSFMRSQTLELSPSLNT